MPKLRAVSWLRATSLIAILALVTPPPLSVVTHLVEIMRQLLSNPLDCSSSWVYKSPVPIFFRPTPYGFRQVVYQTGKTIAFCKFTELKQWQHQSWRQCAYKRELNWIGHNPLSCHRAKQKSNKTKAQNQTKHTRIPKQKTNKNQHGRWSADQFTCIWNVLEEMITLYHLRDWYGTEIKSETTKHKGATR